MKRLIAILLLLLSAPASADVIVLDAPAYTWYRGCGPTSVGMIDGYWDAHGFPEFVKGDDTLGMMDSIAVSLRTQGGWTDVYMLAPGMDAFAASRGYPLATASLEYFGPGSWASYVAEIAAGRPVVVLVATGGIAMNHAVAGIGFDTETHQYAAFNTYDTEVHWYDFAPLSDRTPYDVYALAVFDPGPLPGSVPEPAALALVGTVILVVLGLRQRCRE